MVERFLFLLHSAQFFCSALAKTIFAFVVIICRPLWSTYLLPQVFDVLKHIFVKYISNISGLALNISLLNISAIYRDWLHSFGTRSADEFSKVSSTTAHTQLLQMVKIVLRWNGEFALRKYDDEIWFEVGNKILQWPGMMLLVLKNSKQVCYIF